MSLLGQLWIQAVYISKFIGIRVVVAASSCVVSCCYQCYITSTNTRSSSSIVSKVSNCLSVGKTTSFSSGYQCALLFIWVDYNVKCVSILIEYFGINM